MLDHGQYTMFMNAQFLFWGGLGNHSSVANQLLSTLPLKHQGIAELQCIFFRFHQLALSEPFGLESLSDLTGKPHGTVDWCCAFDGCNLAFWCCLLPRSQWSCNWTVKLLGSTGSTRSPPFLEPRFFAVLILSASRRWSNPWLHMGWTSPQRAIQRHRTFGRTWHTPAFTDLWAQDRIIWIIAGLNS